MNKKATSDDDILGNGLRLSEKIVWSMITQMINNMYQTQEWPNNVI
jgi:hypothetical protein